jgi:hypothetical protein
MEAFFIVRVGFKTNKKWQKSLTGIVKNRTVTK